MDSVALLFDGTDLGRPDLPTGYRLRPYRPGDEQTWFDIHRRTGIYRKMGPERFGKQFGDRPDALASRQFYVEREEDDRPVATVTAWFPHPEMPAGWGRLHWLAVDPACQRQGLGSALVRHVGRVCAALGYTAVYLITGVDNDPALSLYFHHGFRPYWRTPADADAWEAILARRAALSLSLPDRD